jgi:hypothetical protein
MVDDARTGEGPLDYPEAYSRLFRAHPVPMAIWDPATAKILDANDAALDQYGYEAAEIAGLPVDRLVHPDDLPRLREALPRMPAGIARSELFRHLRKDGSELEVEVTGHPIEFNGRAARLVLASDVTQRRRLEEQLRQAQKMEAVGRLAGGIAHDFNNLLMAIMGFSELLLERLPETGEEHEAAEQIREAGARAAQLTSQLLAFSRPAAGRPETIDLDGLLLSMAPMLRGIVGPSIRVDVNPGASRPFVSADRGQLEQVVVNLAVNARDAMPEGGRLSIETVDVSSVAARSLGGVIEDADHVMLTVADTGVGMASDVLDRAFDPFFTTKEPGAATGLGLATAYGAVQRAGGRIRLESTPGHGSTVRIFLPVVAAPAAPDVDEPGEKGSPSARTATILVAEDEPAVRAFVERVLGDAGHRVIAAPDGTAALDLAARHEGPIDLFLTDIVMPGPNGIETARQMVGERPSTRVLYMSGWAAEALEREGLDEDEVALLPKPFSINELLVRVAEVLASDH